MTNQNTNLSIRLNKVMGEIRSITLLRKSLEFFDWIQEKSFGEYMFFDNKNIVKYEPNEDGDDIKYTMLFNEHSFCNALYSIGLAYQYCFDKKEDINYHIQLATKQYKYDIVQSYIEESKYYNEKLSQLRDLYYSLQYQWQENEEIPSFTEWCEDMKEEYLSIKSRKENE